MKTLSTLLIYVAAITIAHAAPTADAKNRVSESSLRSEYHTSWVEDATQPWLRKRASGQGEPCDPGRGECVTGLGCYGCGGHSPVCQRGPGSNLCCHRDNQASVAVCDRTQG
ncbi:hypothetical protein CORC01_02706 [Colletotrichum orchidophilum]|uniref:Uncharacterized protein n=1 Tax=Colletotrichum orchidophilum TaxID=1209926 RepID=A0A1G4BLF9_9PEZI|nr:uncharacterized protein CORC01_02706 [Colletotrichum orchidophilum]OHF02127.1 hypothetical protein CORC01_02706 [Colletotrichum orchidophilum]